MNKSIATQVRDNTLSIFTGVLFLGCAVLAYHIHASAERFDHAYRDYDIAAQASDIAALVPSATNNPVRSGMNTILIQILSKKMTNSERRALAEQGMELLAVSQRQIDAITPKLEEAIAAEIRLRASTDLLSSVFSDGLPAKILAQAEERNAAISDIRAYSYRANFDTQRIFLRVIENNGALPDSFIAELNSEIPAEEEAFNNRQNRYNDLRAVSQHINEDFLAFAHRFSIPDTGE
jgi:hypothetical protein